MSKGGKRYLDIGDEGVSKSMQYRYKCHTAIEPIDRADELEIQSNPIKEPAEHVQISNEMEIDEVLPKRSVFKELRNYDVETCNLKSKVDLINYEVESENADEKTLMPEGMNTIFKDIFDDADLLEKNSSSKPKTIQEFLDSDGFFDKIDVPVALSRAEIMLMILKYCLSNTLSITAMANLFRLQNNIFIRPIFPDSRYLVDQLFNTKDNIEFHAVCHNCTAYVGKFGEIDGIENCNICGFPLDLSNTSNTSYFVIINPSKQISKLLEVYGKEYDYIIKERPNDLGKISDIFYGEEYKKFVDSLTDNEKSNYATGILNTDGAPKFKSSPYSVWPIYLMLNEIPIQDRMNNLVTCGLWFHKKKPEMRIFLHEFVEVAKKLSKDGIKCTINNEPRKIKFFLPVCVVDSVARAPIQGLKQFNGKESCNWCLHPGKWAEGSMRYPWLKSKPELRTHEDMIRAMFKATEKNPEMGVKYPSSLMNLPKFNVVSGFTPDYMHCCLEGVGRQFTEIFVSYMDANVLEEIDSILKRITLPNQVTRLSRALSDRNNWKAREWENFILFSSVPIFSIYLPKKFFKHWLLFVEALYILLKNECTTTDLDKANELLCEFVRKSEELHGISSMTFNLHQMIHLSKSCTDWGPLWAHSCFPFESANFHLLRAIKCAKGVTHQIIRYVNMNQEVLILEEKVFPHIKDIVQIFCEDILNAKIQNVLKVSDTIYFGWPKEITSDTEDLVKDIIDTENSANIYWRMAKRRCLYSSCLKVNARSNNSFAQLSNNKFIKIKEFIVDHETKKQLTSCYYVNVSNSFNNNYCMFKKVISISSETSIIETSEIHRICVFQRIHHVNYICPLPNELHY